MKKDLFFPLLVLVVSTYSWGTMYQTNFPSTDNPLSESGNWVNGQVLGVDWANCRSTPGFGLGTQTLVKPYDDSTCVVAGSWGPDQTVQATVAVRATDSSSWEEVELRLRTTITAHSITGYEINCSVKGGSPYMQIVRWNGPMGSWSQLNGANVGCSNGTVIKATISGSTISVYRNNVPVMSWNDSTFKTGAPGMGFFLQNGSASMEANYGFSAFSADDGTVGGGGSTAPAPPRNLAITIASTSQLNLSWTASVSSGITGYVIKRCQGIGCLNFSSIATVTGLTYGNTNLNASTSYSYYVQAIDSNGIVSAPSATASATTLPAQCP